PANRIVSWHPAVAIWARRDWRVLPYAAMGPVVHYTRAQGARAVVFSTFDPSPLRAPPRAFTVLLVDSTSDASGPSVHIDPVESTPLVFVGRLAPPAPR